MEQVIKTLQARYPSIRYTAGDLFYWSPLSGEVFYPRHLVDLSAAWSLLHETAHAILCHTTYRTDFELIRLEVAAWEKAKTLGQELGLAIDDDHVQDCLDTYRDWLCARSTCPRCSNRALQQADLRHYRCFNCHAKWKVTPSRFCRAYRATVADNDLPAAAPELLA